MASVAMQHARAWCLRGDELRPSVEFADEVEVRGKQPNE